MAKTSIRPSKTRRLKVPRPILAMATPPSDTPTVTIDRLKGGEINWSVKAPAPSVAVAVTRATAEAKRLMAQCLELETLERDERARHKAAVLALAAAVEKAPEVGQ